MAKDTTNNAKKSFLLIPFLRDSSVPIHARVTLGGIIYRNRFAGASISGLVRFLGFDRNTIKAHLKKLHSYVYRENGKWFARCPYNSELKFRYVWKKGSDKDHWYQNIRTIKAESLPLPITAQAQRMIVSSVLYDLLGFLEPRQTKRGLSRMLGISWETCDRALARLVDDGLITMEPITGKRGIEGYNIKRQTKEEKDETVSVEEVADRWRMLIR